MYNVLALGSLDNKQRWVHPSNLWAVNHNAGYLVRPSIDPASGAEFSEIRWIK